MNGERGTGLNQLYFKDLTQRILGDCELNYFIKYISTNLQTPLIDIYVEISFDPYFLI